MAGFLDWIQGKGWEGEGYGYDWLPWWTPSVRILNPTTGKPVENPNGENGTGWEWASDWIDQFGRSIGDFWRDLTGATAADEFAAAEAEKNRDWETEMSNTAYTRSVQDMINAGLNPFSLGSNANPASTPSGASASASSSQGNPLEIISTIARFALYKGLSHKFASSAAAARTAKDVVHNVIDDASDAKMAAKAFDKYGVLKGSQKMTGKDVLKFIRRF